MKRMYDLLVAWGEVIYQYRNLNKSHRNHY
jgi:hypothetical protein